MNKQRDIDLVNELISNGSELPWLEFKKNNSDLKTIGTLCSAISNGARLMDRDYGYVLWGIDDVTHKIVGTTFQPHNENDSNQIIQFWLASRLKPDLVINFKIIQHENGRVVLLEIPFGIDKHNAAQASKIINQVLKLGLIKAADPEHPRAGYVPIWA